MTAMLSYIYVAPFGKTPKQLRLMSVAWKSFSLLRLAASVQSINQLLHVSVQSSHFLLHWFVQSIVICFGSVCSVRQFGSSVHTPVAENGGGSRLQTVIGDIVLSVCFKLHVTDRIFRVRV